MQAYGYMRVSGKAQLARDGFPRQKHAIEKYCKQHSIPLTEVRFYEERAVPGATDMDGRPTMAELLLDSEEEGVKIIIIEALNRLARDLMVQETIIADLRVKGFEVVSTQEPDLCSDEPSRILIRQIFGAVSQYEKSMIVLKLRAARNRVKAKYGRCEGARPFGEEPGEKPILDFMRDAKARGMSSRALAELLNSHGLFTRHGYPWATRATHEIATRAVVRKDYRVIRNEQANLARVQEG